MVGQLKIWVILTHWIERVSFSYALYIRYQILFYHLRKNLKNISYKPFKDLNKNINYKSKS